MDELTESCIIWRFAIFSLELEVWWDQERCSDPNS